VDGLSNSNRARATSPSTVKADESTSKTKAGGADRSTAPQMLSKPKRFGPLEKFAHRLMGLGIDPGPDAPRYVPASPEASARGHAQLNQRYADMHERKRAGDLCNWLTSGAVGKLIPAIGDRNRAATDDAILTLNETMHAVLEEWQAKTSPWLKGDGDEGPGTLFVAAAVDEMALVKANLQDAGGAADLIMAQAAGGKVLDIARGLARDLQMLERNTADQGPPAPNYIPRGPAL